MKFCYTVQAYCKDTSAPVGKPITETIDTDTDLLATRFIHASDRAKAKPKLPLILLIRRSVEWYYNRGPSGNNRTVIVNHIEEVK